jgi:uncharacterized protein (DUF488 family)
MHLYTIGFAGKRAERFFGLLSDHGVRRLIDIRLNPGGQLAGFAKRDDLPYFLRRLANGCDYVHLAALAPTKQMLKDYRADGDWERYAARFEQRMDERSVPASLDRALFETLPCCLLCSEPTPEHCHRRLAAERLARAWPGVEIVHL